MQRQVNRAAAMAAVRREAEDAGAQVFGEGDLHAAMMLVGEAPGKVEAAAHRPFVGPAGIVLNRLLDRATIPRNKLWITNTVKVRPIAAGRRSEVNRPPNSAEVATFRSILNDEIGIVRPRVIVCLGSVAATALIHPNFRIQSERGCWFPGPEGSRLTATYHPAYLLRLRGPDYEVARDHMLADFTRAWREALQNSEHNLRPNDA
jgi:DNA polymerase